MNDATLPNWPREHYEPHGGNPFLFYVVFGAIANNMKLSRSKYRCDEVPGALEMLSYGPETHQEVLDSFRSGYLWDQLQTTQPDLAAAVAASQQCIVLRGAFDDQPTLNYLRNTIGLLACLLDTGGVGIYDPLSFMWWSPSAWREQVFEPAAALPGKHVGILVSEEDDDTQWFHTRGLRKFGRPDLSIHNVPSGYRDAVIELFNRFIALQAFGGVIPEGQEIRMSALPAGMSCRHGGSDDDPDFNNVHVEVLWPGTDAEL